MEMIGKVCGFIVIFIVTSVMSCFGTGRMELKIKVQSASVEQVVLLRNKLKGEYAVYDTVAVIPVREGVAVLTQKVEMPVYVTAVWKGIKYNCNFVLEAGEIEVLDLREDYTVKGGELNGMVIRAVNEHPDYVVLGKEYGQYMKIAADSTVSKAQIQENIKKIQACRSKLWREKSRILLDIYERESSPVNKLILLSSWDFLSRDKGLFYNEVEALAKEIPAENPDMEILQARRRSMQERDAAEQALAMGASTNFIRKSLSGEEYELHRVASEAELTLLEFWASWCAPCRAEIPHLKEAYAKYSGRGFRIYAVSLDAKELAWRDASVKEQFPWINTLDAQPEAEFSIIKAYNVTGIPANFLLDRQGRIVARDLRGDALEKELEKRLGNK